jgi:hypothetical protein
MYNKPTIRFVKDGINNYIVKREHGQPRNKARKLLSVRKIIQVLQSLKIRLAMLHWMPHGRILMKFCKRKDADHIMMSLLRKFVAGT